MEQIIHDIILCTGGFVTGFVLYYIYSYIRADDGAKNRIDEAESINSDLKNGAWKVEDRVDVVTTVIDEAGKRTVEIRKGTGDIKEAIKRSEEGVERASAAVRQAEESIARIEEILRSAEKKTKD